MELINCFSVSGDYKQKKNPQTKLSSLTITAWRGGHHPKLPRFLRRQLNCSEERAVLQSRGGGVEEVPAELQDILSLCRTFRIQDG